jgi:hypothetical protein
MYHSIPVLQIPTYHYRYHACSVIESLLCITDTDIDTDVVIPTYQAIELP